MRGICTARRGTLLLAILLTFGLVAPTAAVAQTPSDGIRDLSLACPSGQVPRGQFNDVRGGAFGLAIDCLAWYDITQGIGGGRYDQSGNVTRGQMANFLYRLIEHSIGAANMPSWNGNSRFSDVPAGSTQARAINVLSSPEIESLLGRRIVTGFGDGTYGPAAPVLREQMATFVARTLEGLFDWFSVTYTPGFCTFRDSSAIANTHRGNVSLICSFGIAGGRADGTYGPRENVTRGQMAAFLMRLVDNFGDIPSPDGPVRLIPLPG